MLREAHAHIPMHGRGLSMLQLGSCRSREELLARVSEYAQSLPTNDPAQWLLAAGVRVSAWPDPSWPTREELDAAAPIARPIALMSFDHHCVAANSAALTAAKIADNTPDPPGGIICRDELTGRPNGVLLESAAMQVWRAAPDISPAQRRSDVLAALQDLASHGFTSVHDMLSPPWLGPLLADLADTEQLHVEVWLYAPLAELEAQARTAATWQRPGVTLAGGKVFADGTLNSKTAWMLAPYANPLVGLPTGSALMDVTALANAMDQAARLNLGLAVHAIGDAAVRATLDAATLTRCGGFLPGAVPALRIEHCELIDPADVPRFYRQRIVASVQPCHLLADIEVLTRELPHRLDRVLPLRELIDSGCVPGDLLWFGSDTPIVRPDPEDSIIAATLRRRVAGPPIQIAPKQAILPREALAAFTPQGH